MMRIENSFMRVATTAAMLFAATLFGQNSHAVENGTPIRMLGHCGWGTAVDISPDGKKILIGGVNGEVLDVETGRVIQNFWFVSTTSTYDASFSPDGERALFGGQDSLSVWSVSSGLRLQQYSNSDWYIRFCAFSPDATKILLGHETGKVTILDAKTGGTLHTFSGFYFGVLSPDGLTVLLTSGNSAALYDVETGAEVISFSGHEDDVSSYAFSSDGSKVITGGKDNTIRIWNAATGSEIRKFNVGDVETIVSFYPDESRILTVVSGDPKIIKVRDALTGEELFASMKDQPINAFCFVESGPQILSKSDSYDIIFRLWDLETGNDIKTYNGFLGTVNAVGFSSTGEKIITADYSAVKLWKTSTSEEIRSFQYKEKGAYDAQLSPDDSQILAGCITDPVAILWDADTGEERQVFSGHEGAIATVAFSPDASTVLTGSYDKTARLWDISTGEELRNFGVLENVITSVAFSPDGTKIIVGSGYGHYPWDAGEGEARLFSVATGEVLDIFTESNRVEAVAFTPNGDQILVSHYGGRVSIYDLETKAAVFSKSSFGNQTAILSPDGKKVLASELSYHTPMWDVETGEYIRTFNGQIRTVSALAFSPDGSMVLTGAEGTAVLWYVGDPPEEEFIRHFYIEVLERVPFALEQQSWQYGYFNYSLGNNIDVRFVGREMGRQFFNSAEYSAKNTTNEEFIASCYRTFLYRDPSDQELADWLAGEWNRQQAMTGFAESEEFAQIMLEMFPDKSGDATRNFVTFMYIGFLDRLVDSGGLSYWADVFDAAIAGSADAVETARAEAKAMARSLMSSAEYTDKQPTNEDHVVRLYRGLLGRYPSDIEVGYWTGELAAGRQTTDSLVDAFAMSEEFTTILNEYFGE